MPLFGLVLNVVQIYVRDEQRRQIAYICGYLSIKFDIDSKWVF